MTAKPSTAREHTPSGSRNAVGLGGGARGFSGGGVLRAGAVLAVAGNFGEALKGGVFNVGKAL